jgi:hypothetical protein
MHTFTKKITQIVKQKIGFIYESHNNTKKIKVNTLKIL